MQKTRKNTGNAKTLKQKLEEKNIQKKNDKKNVQNKIMYDKRKKNRCKMSLTKNRGTSIKRPEKLLLKECAKNK